MRRNIKMFKIGDKVKLISNQDTDNIAVGSVCLVTDTTVGMYYTKIFDTATNQWDWVQSATLELYKEYNVKPITDFTMEELEEFLTLRKPIEDWETYIKNLHQVLLMHKIV